MSMTEDRDPRFNSIDQWPTVDAVEAMLDGQIAAILAIRDATQSIAIAADAAAHRLSKGGRLIYAGAGTSGRVAVQDGVELSPTFGWPENRLGYLLAGGMAALSHSAEGAEDDEAAGKAAVLAEEIGDDDVVVGVAASGRTPFTIAVLNAARAAGALTIAISNNPDAPILDAGEYGIVAATGSEIIAGSTRMKAGTAQKAILNILSTAIMLRLGRVYNGLMVDMQISNDKLQARAEAMIASITGCSDQKAAKALEQTGRDIKAAILVALGATPSEARVQLTIHKGILRSALDQSGLFST
jgi:N-acetylmuramic acid 6-phosphate etherase